MDLDPLKAKGCVMLKDVPAFLVSFVLSFVGVAVVVDKAADAVAEWIHPKHKVHPPSKYDPDRPPGYRWYYESLDWR